MTLQGLRDEAEVNEELAGSERILFVLSYTKWTESGPELQSKTIAEYATSVLRCGTKTRRHVVVSLWVRGTPDGKLLRNRQTVFFRNEAHLFCLASAVI